MRVILTHEQADFDALAALLGASLLDEQALAVLPRRLNRNVRAYLNLYGSELPLHEVRDLPNEPIETVTLVDTQSLVTLKGMSKHTRVRVIDHHQPRADLPPEWQVTIERVGACTTLLVEALRERLEPLNSHLATLLLLGIYEDTGSLTYNNTTARDAHAVAYLLEQGASLHLASQFLNPPLSEDQREVYHRLLASAETLEINGQTIVIAKGEATGLVEEVSSIAHKLRDLLDPDGLFLLVKTAEGIRLVARSTTDRINVAEIAALFGGGGHERAAAALIRIPDLGVPDDNALDVVYQRLIEALPDKVQPAITVEQIMSPRPMVISPETSAQEAAQLMQRYGYEGYPVVKDGKVIGLLTRRAVDRALAHRLNLPASSLMEAGEVVVRPQDPLEVVQRLMAETGWGQIPVIDPESQTVIGIVTRTDLLKALGRNHLAAPARQNFADRLEAALPPARLALLKLIADRAHRRRLPVYVVGGFVRDLLLNRPSQDFDIVVEGDAIALARALERELGGRVTSHSRFGTAKWHIAEIRASLLKNTLRLDNADLSDLPEYLDFISARTEFYDYPTALPTVERSSIKLDLHRRDFTINTLALRLDGRHYGDLYDYWGGYADLQRGLIRVLHSLSFVDDPTRMLRAVRFEQRFGFQIEDRTLQLMHEARDLLRQVSGDRLRHELELILAEEDPLPALQRLEELQLLESIHPDLHWNPQLNDPMHAALKAPLESAWNLPETWGGAPIRRMLAYLVWFLPLLAEKSANLAQRLRLPHHLREGLKIGAELIPDLPGLLDCAPSRIVARLDGVPLPVIYALFLLDRTSEIAEVLSTYATRWRHIHPVTDGHTLRAMGVSPGPAYRRILWALRAAWLDGEIHSPEEERRLLEQLIPTKPHD